MKKKKKKDFFSLDKFLKIEKKWLYLISFFNRIDEKMSQIVMPPNSNNIYKVKALVKGKCSTLIYFLFDYLLYVKSEFRKKNKINRESAAK